MVDVLSNCAQRVSSRWDTKTKSTPSTYSKQEGPAKRRDLYEKHRPKIFSENFQQAQDRELFRTKENCWSAFSYRAPRPLSGSCCKSCTPNSKEHMGVALKNRSVRNILQPDTQTDKSFVIRAFCHLTQNYRIKKFKYPQVAGSVLVDKRLREAIETTAQALAHSVPVEEQTEEQYKQILTAQEDRAKRILLDMRSTLSDFLLRVTSWILYKLLPRFLTSVCLHPSQLEMLQKASSTNLPLIFVPLHRSHLDYILITFILLNINVKSPLVAAGNNLKIPVFGSLLRGLGAFFIKRRIDPAAGRKDVLYRAVLHTYMMQCLEAGHNIEFYIEGGRTRTGKPCMPKSGLLSVIIDAYMAGKVQDALLIPVSVNYDKLVDGNFIRELLGQPKEMETFFSAMSAIWTTLSSNYGSMRIDFNQPFSLKELVKSFQMMNKLKRQSSSDLGSQESTPTKNGFACEKVFRSFPSTTSLYGTDVVDEDHRGLVDSIARHLVYDCAKACAVMSTNILAFLLLNKYREGVRVDELVFAFDDLRRQLMLDHRDLGFSGKSIDVINNAVNLLGSSLVERKKEVLESGESYEVITPVTVLPNVIELSYYSNGLLSHFMVEGVLAISMKVSGQLFKLYGDKMTKITLDSVMVRAQEICDILQFEFIFVKPCQTLDTVLGEMFEKFHMMDIIRTEESVMCQQEKWCQKFSSNYDSEDEDEFNPYNPVRVFHINTSAEERDTLDFFSTLLLPLIDVYAVAATCLPMLFNKHVAENEFVQEVLSKIKTELENGSCLYGESCSVDPIKNACKLFKKWGVIEIMSQNSVRFFYLSEEYCNNPDLVEGVQKKIEMYRVKPNKNSA